MSKGKVYCKDCKWSQFTSSGMGNYNSCKNPSTIKRYEKDTSYEHVVFRFIAVNAHRLNKNNNCKHFSKVVKAKKKKSWWRL